MLLRADTAGDVEWCVEEGAAVVPGQLLAFLNPTDRCGSRRLVAPAPGVVTARRSALWRAVEPGAALAALDGTEDDVRTLRREEQRGLAARLDALREPHGALAQALIVPERHAVERRLTELAAALSPSARP